MFPKFTDILKENKALENKDQPYFNIAAISNTTITSLKDVLEYTLRKESINAKVTIGEYDNILQEADKYKDSDCIIIMYEAGNFTDLFPYEGHEVQNQKELLKEKLVAELKFIFEKLSSSKSVFFNLISLLPFDNHSLSSIIDPSFILDINYFIVQNAPKNFTIVDPAKIYAQLGVAQAVDMRFFLSSKSLYRYEFHAVYSQLILPAIRNNLGRIKKVLALDCDNTLWKGILGEDGPDGIKMYKEIQALSVKLAERGILIALCSKNNLKDIQELIDNNEDMIIKPRHITAYKVNWEDKAINLKLLSEDLNLGLDSFVFVDDSDFEINLVKTSLPQILTLQTPKNYSEYVSLFKTLDNIFFRKIITREDLDKADQYKKEYLRKDIQKSFHNIEDYLKSLELEITCHVDDKNQISRLSQLTQKTNQFNLTTKRYVEADIGNFIESENHNVFSFNVHDRYGEYGWTGLLIADYENKAASIDSFMLSCRVLGRKIEHKILDWLVAHLMGKGYKTLNAQFNPTLKNQQVEKFYDELGFNVSKDGPIKNYSLELETYKYHNLEYIEVKHG